MIVIVVLIPIPQLKRASLVTLQVIFLVPLETTNLEVITTRKLSFNQFPLKS